MDDQASIPPEEPSRTLGEQFPQVPAEPAPEPEPILDSATQETASQLAVSTPIATHAAEPERRLVPAWASLQTQTLPPHANRRQFLSNLYLLLGLSLAAFTLTAWILVRVDLPFAIFSTGPQQVVRAQLRALDRGELQTAYDMFSARYRRQVTFNEWHELIVTHWRMFHVEILDAGQLAQTGARATLEIHVRGADDKPYRARFTLVRAGGRWWVDDLHWSSDQDDGSTIRI